jgi:hypothetical protein
MPASWRLAPLQPLSKKQQNIALKKMNGRMGSPRSPHFPESACSSSANDGGRAIPKMSGF